jgi:hypothetical protein
LTALALRQPMRAPGLVVMLALMLVGFSVASHEFATAGNVLNILLQSSVLLLLALPMTFVILTEGLDLSIGAVLSLCSVALALAAVGTGLFVVALAVAVAVGLVAGPAQWRFGRVSEDPAVRGDARHVRNRAKPCPNRKAAARASLACRTASCSSTMGRYSACARQSY